MKTLQLLSLALTLMPVGAGASEYSDAVIDQLYAGTASQGIPAAEDACASAVADACFGLGLLKLVDTYEGLAQDLYRYGAVTPDDTPAGLILGLGVGEPSAPANPSPDRLTYPALRGVLEDFVAGLDAARASFEQAGTMDDFAVTIDPLRVRLDLDGDGTASHTETLGVLIASAGVLAGSTSPDGLVTGGKRKTKTQAPSADTTIGFDRADAVWFSGYTQIAATPVDLLLAHDFSLFYDAYLHRVFPKAGLPMQDQDTGGLLFLDAAGDAGIADLIAGIHTLNFPVTDRDRLMGVLARLKAVTASSRRNWELILAETDDNRELVPSPRQTPLAGDMPVTQEIVDAWLATLDTVDQVLDGKLLVPHWRFRQGFDLQAYFATAEQTDLVMLSGAGALPYLRDGPVADAQSFAQANRALGADWINYAFWFN